MIIRIYCVRKGSMVNKREKKRENRSMDNREKPPSYFPAFLVAFCTWPFTYSTLDCFIILVFLAF